MRVSKGSYPIANARSDGAAPRCFVVFGWLTLDACFSAVFRSAFVLKYVAFYSHNCHIGRLGHPLYLPWVSFWHLGAPCGTVGAAGRTPGDPGSILAIWERLRDLILQGFWVPRTQIPSLLFNLISRSFCVLSFESQSGRLRVSKRGYREESLAKIIFLPKAYLISLDVDFEIQQ